MRVQLLGRVLEPLLSAAAREVLSRLNQPCLLLSAERTVVLANQWFRERFEDGEAEPEGRSLFAIAGGAFDIPEVRALFDEVAVAGPIHQRQVEIRFPGVGARRLQVGIIPLQGWTFASSFTVLVLHDETDRVRLAEQRARLSRAVEHARDAIVIADAAGMIEYVNPAFERLTGIQPTAAVGRPVTGVLQLPTRTLARLGAGVRRHGHWSGVLSGWRADAGTYELDVVASEVRGEEDRTVGYVAVGRDLGPERVLERRIDSERAERATVAFALARLHPMATAEEAAAALCRELSGLPWVDAVAVIDFSPSEKAIPIAVEGPLGVPLHRHVALPSAVGLRLRERLASGPWVDDLALTRSANGDDPYLDAWWRVGVMTLAHVPLQDQKRRDLALLVVGTRLPGGTEEMAKVVPTIVELGAFAEAMVGPKLSQHRDRMRAQRRIWDVVAAGSFRPVFQPIVDLRAGTVVGYEALTRFEDGTPPTEFFAEARAVGLDIVLERAVTEAALAASAGLPRGPWLSLNLSPTHLLSRRPGPFPPGPRSREIVVEIAEQTAIDDYARLREVVDSLRADGVGIAVDDVGVGFDSLRRLLELRPDFIKLDVSLTRGLDGDSLRQALVGAMVLFAQEAHCGLIAEGVERPAEREVLSRLGVGYGQGYLLGPPEPAADRVRRTPTRAVAGPMTTIAARSGRSGASRALRPGTLTQRVDRPSD